MKINKRLTLPLIATLLIVASATAIYYSTRSSENSESTESAPADGLTGIEFTEATEQERADADKNKEAVTERINQENNPPSDDSVTSVTPVISAFGQNSVTGKVEVGSFVPGVFENGGTCTTTLTKSEETRSKTTTGIENVSSVSCGFATFEQGELSAGTWKAVVSYSSETASGTSDVVDIEVK